MNDESPPPDGPPPIAGVPTSIAAFLGETERGPVRPTEVSSLKDFRRRFGGRPAEACALPDAVAGFFDNGGRHLWVCRVAGAGATTASRMFGAVTVSAAGPGGWGRRVYAAFSSDPGGDARFRLRVAYWAASPSSFEAFDPFDPADDARGPRPQVVEDHGGLSLDPSSPDFCETRLAGAAGSVLVRAVVHDQAAWPAAAGAGFLDVDGADGGMPLAGDFDGTGGGPGAEPQGLSALDAMQACDDVALVYAPWPRADATAVASAIVSHCERRRSRFAMIDPPLEGEPSSIDPRHDIPADSSHAALYAPWIQVGDIERPGQLRLVPPGGHVLGVYARTDAAQGVFKAPANEAVRGATGLAFAIGPADQEILAGRGVNTIRQFPGRGLIVWGARTLSSADDEWKYVPVRRLFIFLERSIEEGLRWVVFEPNDERLWARVAETVRQFLRAQWRAGAFRGRTEREAFFVRCDRTTMTEDDILNGRMIVEIGVAPLRPAEYVLFRIGQWTSSGV